MLFACRLMLACFRRMFVTLCMLLACAPSGLSRHPCRRGPAGHLTYHSCSSGSRETLLISFCERLVERAQGAPVYYHGSSYRKQGVMETCYAHEHVSSICEITYSVTRRNSVGADHKRWWTDPTARRALADGATGKSSTSAFQRCLGRLLTPTR